MSDKEIIVACAEAMEYSVVKGDGRYKNGIAIATKDGEPITNYDPLAHDEQALALVKECKFLIMYETTSPMGWLAILGNVESRDKNLNRAICECIAKKRKQ